MEFVVEGGKAGGVDECGRKLKVPKGAGLIGPNFRLPSRLPLLAPLLTRHALSARVACTHTTLVGENDAIVSEMAWRLVTVWQGLVRRAKP